MNDWQITGAMLIWGGGFVEALAQAWRCADTRNQGKLKAAFPEIFSEYEQLAEHYQRQQAEAK